jgi:NAD/NADP transhydrogenase alpha subunit
MYAKNLSALIALLTKDGKLNLDMNDDIIAAVTVATGGEIRNQSIRNRLVGAQP